MATKVQEGTLLFVAYHRVVHDTTVQRMFGSAWKSKMAVGRVLGSDTKRQGTCRRAERYVTCEWFVLPERRKRELAARSCLLRVDVVRKCRIADVVVHEAYMDDLHDLDMTDITVIAPAPAIPSTAPTGAPDDGDARACNPTSVARWMFISTRGSTADAAPIERVRWHQTPYGAKRQTRVIPIHRLGAEYFAYRDIVDQHNRSHQDTLNLWRKSLRSSRRTCASTQH